MPGLAQTSQFLLSTATVMLGPLAELNQLTPSKHSIGLVKNFQMTMDPQYTELTQGLSNTIVMSVRTADGLKASMEVYEYTLRNLSYAAGLDASGVGFDQITELYTTTGVASDLSVEVGTDVTNEIETGDYIFIQAGTDDVVHIAKVEDAVFAAASTTITFATGYAMPVGVTFPAGSRIGKVKRTDISTGALAQPELACKVVGLLPKNNEPFTILFPKVKVTKGMNVAFQSDNFGNLPFELTPYNGVPTDPMYNDFGSAAGILFPR